MRFLLVEIVVPLLVLLFVRSLIRSVFAEFRRAASPPARREPSAPPVPAGGDLKKDPVCGTYVSTVGSISQRVNGQVIYFCSKECRDKYRAA